MQKSCPKHQFATKQNHNLEQQFAKKKKIVSRIIICNFKIIARNNNMVDHFQARFSFEDHYQNKELWPLSKCKSGFIELHQSIYVVKTRFHNLTIYYTASNIQSTRFQVVSHWLKITLVRAQVWRAVLKTRTWNKSSDLRICFCQAAQQFVRDLGNGQLQIDGDMHFLLSIFFVVIICNHLLLRSLFTVKVLTKRSSIHFLQDFWD